MRHATIRSILVVAASIGVVACSSNASVVPTASPTSVATAATDRPATPSAPAPSVAAVASASADPDCPPEPSTWPAPLAPPKTGRILFTAEGPCLSHLFYLDLNGLHEIPIGNDNTIEHAIWGPGNTIIFESKRAGGYHLFRMDADGGNVVQLTSGDTSQDTAAVSPTGSKLAYGDYVDTGVEATDHDLGIHTANIDGTDPRALTPAHPPGALEGDDEPAYSPDGRWIAFVRVLSGATNDSSIFLIRPDGTGLRRLTNDGIGDDRERWSPDGKLIVFNGNGSGQAFMPGSLWTVDLAGGKPKPLTDPKDPGISFEGAWSPDGTQVVYHNFTPDTGSISLRVVDADGSGPKTMWVAPEHYSAESPFWGN